MGAIAEEEFYEDGAVVVSEGGACVCLAHVIRGVARTRARAHVLIHVCPQSAPRADVMDSLYLVKEGLVCVDVTGRDDSAQSMRQASSRQDEDDPPTPSGWVLGMAGAALSNMPDAAAGTFSGPPATAATGETAAGAATTSNKTSQPPSTSSSFNGSFSKDDATQRPSSSKQSFKGSFKRISSYPFGESFGASALTGRHDDEWPSTFVAKGSATVLRLRREAVVEMLGADLAQLLRDNLGRRTLGAFGMLSLSTAQISLLLESSQQAYFAAGDKILSQGDQKRTLYVIRTGTARVTVHKSGANDGEVTVTELMPGDYFGEYAVLGKPAVGTITALKPTTCLAIDLETFEQVADSVREEMEAIKKRRQEEMARKLEVGNVGVEDFNKLALLGVGTFGVVSLVEHTSSRKPYALKAMLKKKVLFGKQV